MKIRNFLVAALCAEILSVSLPVGRAQTVDTWIGPASGGEWNTAANWSTGVPPLDPTTNAFIGSGTNVSYNFPMASAGFGALNNNGILNINTNGFNCTSISDITGGGGEKLFMNTGAVVTVNTLTLGTNTSATLSAGASLTVNGALTLAANESSHASGSSILTNSGGYLSAQSTTINNNQGTGTGLLLINGGTNYLGNTAVGRNNSGAGGTTLGTEGLVINNGLVIMTNLNLGNAGNGLSSLSAYITGGTVTNFGSVFINQGSSGRFSRLLQTGGTFVVPDPGVVNPNPTVSGSLNNYTVFGGTNVVGGFYFGNSNNTSGGTVNFTNGAVIYVGSQGIASNGVILLNALLNNNGLFGATADWAGSAAMKLNNGTFTFQAADQNGTGHSIALSGVLSGSGNLNKTGAGTLTLSAANTYSGNTVISGGTLAVGAGGSLASPNINVGSGAIFDVSGTGGFTLNGGQTLAGSGTVNGAVTASSSSTIYPGSNSVTGTLTLPGGLTENGGVNNQFNLSGNPSGPNNDSVNVSGGLILAGTNSITIIGALAGGGAYPLFNYSSLTGDITNFEVVGAGGALSNSLVAHTIYFVAQSNVRGPTNITWIGNAANNIWDTQASTNWLNNGTGTLDFFLPNDQALFSNLGASNSVVNIPGSVTPSSVTVNTTSNYVFTGNGEIDGIASLTVSNGTLTVLTTNNYTGQTIFDGGVLATPNIANGGSPSGIGAATADPANLIFNGGALFYFGDSTATDHGMTLTNLGGTIDVTNGTILTLNGTLAGNGSLTKVDGGSLTLTAGNTYTGNTILTGGTLTMNNVTAAGSGTIVLNGGNLAVGAFKPANAINVTANSQISGGNAGGLTGIKNVTGGFNLLLAVTTGVFDLTGDMSTYSGTITFSNASGTSVRLNGSIGSPLAIWDLGSGPAMDLMVRTSSSSNNIGALRGAGGTTLSGRGGSSNNGATTYYIGAIGLDTVFDGIIENGSGGSASITSINKVGSGTLALSGQNTYSGTTTVGSGTLALVFNPTNGADGSINNSATINVVSGAALDVSGRSDDTLQLGSSGVQTLEGRGTILGNLTVNGSGTVAPGGGAGGNTGTLTVTNSVQLFGNAWMKLNRANTPNCDQVVSSLSTITYGGTLTVTNIGARLQAGDTFTLFSGGGLSTGSFGQINLPNYYTWDTSNLGVNGSIRVTAVLPLPSITNVDFSTLSSGTITLNAFNGAPNGPVTVLTTTNLSLPTSSWTTVATTTFDSNGNLNLPITVDPTLPQSFFQLQTY